MVSEVVSIWNETDSFQKNLVKRTESEKENGYNKNPIEVK